MPSIQIRVSHRIPVQTNAEAYIFGNGDYTVEFGFDREWDAFPTKTARFRWDGKFTDVVFTGSSCPFPRINGCGDVEVGVFAGDVCTTVPAKIPARRSILDEDGSPAAPEETVYGQLMALLNESGLALEETEDGIRLTVRYHGGSDSALIRHGRDADLSGLPDAIASYLNEHPQSVSPEAVEAMVADYLANHPAAETDPTVPAWAKQPNKPSYTASEISGAVQKTGAILSGDLVMFGENGKITGTGIPADQFATVEAVTRAVLAALPTWDGGEY